MNIQLLKRRLGKAEFERQAARKQVQQEKEILDVAVHDVENTAKAQALLQLAAQAVQQKAHQQIADVVSRCLSAVFEDPYSFKIYFDKKRGKTEARLVFVRDGMEVDPLTSSGGGVIDVASFALRLSCLLLSRPSLRKLLVLDEAFRFLSIEYRPRVVRLLELLSDEMGVQIVLITHDPQLQVGKVIEL